MKSKLHPDDMIKLLQASQEYFNRSTRVLEESDSGFRPNEAMMTVSEHVAHTAQTLTWFVEGATRPEGFNLDFEQLGQAVQAVNSLDAARKMLDSAYGSTIEFLKASTPESLEKPLPAGPVMGEQPTGDIVWAIVEHTAHHRGALTVYTRLLGKVPVMPYGG
jgi:uncharacterized damage-inducible protein DinB